jgi:hypothetical protein
MLILKPFDFMVYKRYDLIIKNIIYLGKLHFLKKSVFFSPYFQHMPKNLLFITVF